MPQVKPWYAQNSEFGQAYQEFYNAGINKSVFDDKTRELLQVALACVFRCPHCTESHIKKALAAGCTKQEVTEALLMAALEASGTQLAWLSEVFIKYLGKEEPEEETFKRASFSARPEGR